MILLGLIGNNPEIRLISLRHKAFDYFEDFKHPKAFTGKAFNLFTSINSDKVYCLLPVIYFS